MPECAYGQGAASPSPCQCEGPAGTVQRVAKHRGGWSQEPSDPVHDCARPLYRRICVAAGSCWLSMASSRMQSPNNHNQQVWCLSSMPCMRVLLIDITCGLTAPEFKPRPGCPHHPGPPHPLQLPPRPYSDGAARSTTPFCWLLPTQPSQCWTCGGADPCSVTKLSGTQLATCRICRSAAFISPNVRPLPARPSLFTVPHSGTRRNGLHQHLAAHTAVNSSQLSSAEAAPTWSSGG